MGGFKLHGAMIRRDCQGQSPIPPLSESLEFRARIRNARWGLGKGNLSTPSPDIQVDQDHWKNFSAFHLPYYPSLVQNHGRSRENQNYRPGMLLD
jgi:hypothetical protein